MWTHSCLDKGMWINSQCRSHVLTFPVFHWSCVAFNNNSETKAGFRHWSAKPVGIVGKWESQTFWSQRRRGAQCAIQSSLLPVGQLVRPGSVKLFLTCLVMHGMCFALAHSYFHWRFSGSICWASSQPSWVIYKTMLLPVGVKHLRKMCTSTGCRLYRGARQGGSMKHSGLALNLQTKNY